MLRCLIIDDEPFAVNLLEAYIQQTPFLQLAGKCYNAIDALHFLRSTPVDLLLLDINMPQLSGMQLAGLLNQNYQIIFTTAYSEYAVESYELNAVDYLLKPITFERFMKAVQKALAARQEPPLPAREEEAPSTFFVKSGKAVVKLNFAEILYIEALGDYVVFHLSSEKHVVYKRMKELETTLPDYFCRVHNSHIINLNHIAKIEDNQVFIGAMALPVSEKYRDNFWRHIQARLFT